MRSSRAATALAGVGLTIALVGLVVAGTVTWVWVGLIAVAIAAKLEVSSHRPASIR